jgi:hypothetical protein
MNFFRIDHDSTNTRSFAWAAGFGPLLTEMTFLNPVEKERYEKFWKVNPRRPGIIVDDGESRAKWWPDFMGHGGGSPRFFASEKVVRSLEGTGIEYARTTEMPIAEVICKDLNSTEPPRYFVLEADPGIEIDHEASTGRPARVFRESSWTGKDLMGWPNIWNSPSPSLICTEKVVELARAAGWTNVRFEKIHLT